MEWKLDEYERDKFLAWDEKHKADRHSGKEPYAGAIGGRLTFSVTGTSLGQVVTVKCGLCGEECDLSDYDSW